MKPVTEGCQSYPRAAQSFLHDQEPTRKCKFSIQISTIYLMDDGIDSVKDLFKNV